MSILEEFIEIRKKFYFVNYKNDAQIAKRIFYILSKKSTKGISSFAFEDIICALHWGLGVTSSYRLVGDKETQASEKMIKKQKSPRMSIEAKLHSIAKALSILENSKLIKISEIDSIDIETSFELYFIEVKSLFEIKISQSDFAPIYGSRQILTQGMRHFYCDELMIKYNELIKRTDNYNLAVSEIMPVLEKRWIESYNVMIARECLLTKYPVDSDKSDIFNYSHIFHDSSMEYDIDILSNDFIEDRTVCVYGISSKKIAARDTSDAFMRQAEARNWSDGNTDRGHYLGHSIGGSIYANIFPQKREINRGTSQEGKRFRDMEGYLRKTSGLFCFSRPIYFDFSCRPFIIEFGYLDTDFKWVIESFENV